MNPAIVVSDEHHELSGQERLIGDGGHGAGPLVDTAGLGDGGHADAIDKQKFVDPANHAFGGSHFDVAALFGLGVGFLAGFFDGFTKKHPGHIRGFLAGAAAEGDLIPGADGSASRCVLKRGYLRQEKFPGEQNQSKEEK